MQTQPRLKRQTSPSQGGRTKELSLTVAQSSQISGQAVIVQSRSHRSCSLVNSLKLKNEELFDHLSRKVSSFSRNQTSCFIVVFCLSITCGKDRGSVHGRDSIVRNNRSAIFCNSYDDIVRSVSKQSSASPSFDMNGHQALSDHYETPLSPLSGTLSPLCLYCLIYQ